MPYVIYFMKVDYKGVGGGGGPEKKGKTRE